MLTIATESLHGVPFLRVSGNIERGDSNDTFVEAIHRLLESSRIVACDLSQVASIDSTGVATLIAAHEDFRSLALTVMRQTKRLSRHRPLCCGKNRRYLGV